LYHPTACLELFLYLSLSMIYVTIKSIVTHVVNKRLNQSTWGWIEASHPITASNHISYFDFTFVEIVKFCKVYITLCLAINPI